MEGNSDLLIKRNLTLTYVLSILIALLMAVVSAAGLLYRDKVYPTNELIQSFAPNDVVNILIGLPILLLSMWLARRGKLIGLLLWPGALIYVAYNYMVYVFAMPLSAAFLAHLLLLVLSLFTLIGLVSGIDSEIVAQKLKGNVSERLAGGILTGLGSLFFLRVIALLADAIINQHVLANTELAVLISDFFFTPTWVIGGILLWRRKKWGYVVGLGLLFQASMLFIGLIIFMLLQPILTNTSFVLADVVVVFVMGLICFIPLMLFARGIGNNQNLFF